MKIIVFSETTARSIAANLGKSEYSYFFILRAYLPVLETLGEIVYVDDPEAEVDAVYSRAIAAGESAVFLSFSPPHRTCTRFTCPTVCVIAWEFSSIPDRDLGNGPGDNWVEALSEVGNVITISDYSSKVIRQQVGEGLYMATIPAPVTTAPSPSRSELETSSRPGQSRLLSVSADVVDTRELVIRDDVVYPGGDAGQGIDDPDLPPWDGTPLLFHFDGYTPENNGSQQLVGFHPPEAWGAWSRSDQPWINLPVRVSGDFELTLELVGFGKNVGRQIDIRIGNQTRSVTIDDELRSYCLQFTDVESGGYIAFANLVTDYTVGANLLKALSVGVGKATLVSTGDPVALPEMAGQPAGPEIKRQDLQLEGLVYTTVLNPEDERKNWEDILKAFCWAFRDDDQATLILKMSCPSMSATWGRLLTLFSRLNPFSCRILVIHGYLDDAEMTQLRSVTDYVVNASHAEGQCLPLLEFMAAGVPAIAPKHTAMASYIRPENAFVVNSWRQATFWPQDPKQIKRTFYYGIDWASLMHCFEDSARLAREQTAVYGDMANCAMRDVRERYSLARCEEQLSAYLRRFTRTGRS